MKPVSKQFYHCVEPHLPLHSYIIPIVKTPHPHQPKKMSAMATPKTPNEKPRLPPSPLAANTDENIVKQKERKKETDKKKTENKNTKGKLYYARNACFSVSPGPKCKYVKPSRQTMNTFPIVVADCKLTVDCL